MATIIDSLPSEIHAHVQQLKNMLVLEHFPGTDKVNDIHLSIRYQTIFDVAKHISSAAWISAGLGLSMETPIDYTGDLDNKKVSRIAVSLIRILVIGPAAPGIPKKLMTNDTNLRTLLGAKLQDLGLTRLNIEEASTEENATADRLWVGFDTQTLPTVISVVYDGDGPFTRPPPLRPGGPEPVLFDFLPTSRTTASHPRAGIYQYDGFPRPGIRPRRVGDHLTGSGDFVWVRDDGGAVSEADRETGLDAEVEETFDLSGVHGSSTTTTRSEATAPQDDVSADIGEAFRNRRLRGVFR